MLLKPMLVGLLVAGAGVGVRVAALPITQVSLPERAEARSLEVPQQPRIAVDSLTAATVARDPFRITRRPAPVAYDPLKAGQPPVPIPSKPALTLVGIVWDGGMDPTALLEGLPGADGARVARAGDTIGSFKVKRIERQRVVIVGLDTVWVLTVREPWH